MKHPWTMSEWERSFRQARLDRWMKTVEDALVDAGLPANPWEWTEAQKADVAAVLKSIALPGDLKQ